MTRDKLGDSYDIVKKSLLHWLGGRWSVHPMLTEKADQMFFSAYETLISAKVISSSVLTQKDRKSCLSPACSCRGNLFLDPDTGLKLGKPKIQHLSADELIEIVEPRSKYLTVVFDQSFSYGDRPERKMLEKLSHLSLRGVHAFAYVSHACFIVATGEKSRLDRARTCILKSGLPECRLTPPAPSSHSEL